jgi:hypothetical protein
MTSRLHPRLKEKLQLINDSNHGNRSSHRKLAEKYNISRGSVSNML